MYFPSAPFSPNDAVICSALVNAAYDTYDRWAARGCPSDPSQFSWAEPTGPLVPNGPTLSYLGPMWGVANMDDYAFPEPFAFLAWESNGRTYPGFRGSETSADFWEDAAFDQVSYDPIVPGFGLVHDGFNDVYTSSYSSTGYSVAALRSTILSALGHLSYTPTALYVSGHSLGAGLSTLCVPDVARNSQLGKLGIPTFRIANTEDLVPDEPPAVSEWYYEHVGTPVSFTAQYNSIGGNHDHQHCYFYALTHPNQPQGPIAALKSAELASSARTRVVAARRRYEQLKGNPQPRRQS